MDLHAPGTGTAPARRNRALASGRYVSGPTWRCNPVAIPPGISALAVMPSPAQRRVASTANRTFAVLDCPYADPASSGRSWGWLKWVGLAAGVGVGAAVLYEELK